jgi:hypothetical protein
MITMEVYEVHVSQRLLLKLLRSGGMVIILSVTGKFRSIRI